jgi:hypothetical protein
MDDLKLIGRSEEELRKEIKIVKAISNDISLYKITRGKHNVK